MSPAGFLLLALGISIVGSLVLWARSHKPGGIDASIDGFRRELAALSPERSPDAVVREQSRLRAEGRWIERPPPSGPATGGDASSVVVRGADAFDPMAASGHEPASEWVQDDSWDGGTRHPDEARPAVDDPYGPDDVGGDYFDELYLDDEER